MATGYRLVKADYSPTSPFADGVTTEPGTISEPFWCVSPGLQRLALVACFTPASPILQQVTYNTGDILDTLEWGNELRTDDPQDFFGVKISGGTVADLYTDSGDFTDAALSPEPSA